MENLRYQNYSLPPPLLYRTLSKTLHCHAYTAHELCHKKLVLEKMPLGVNFVVVILVLIGMPEAKSSHFKVVADTIWHKGMPLVESVMRNVALWDWLKATPMRSNLRSVVFARLVRAGLDEHFVVLICVLESGGSSIGHDGST